MSSLIPYSTWIQLAEITQYRLGADLSSDRSFSGGVVSPRNPRLLYIIRKALNIAYNNNPNDPALYPTFTFMYQLLGPYINIAQNILNAISSPPPSFSGPNSQTVNIGANVTFSISNLVGTAPFTYQWYLGGTAIVGATNPTLVLTNVQPSSSTELYSVAVTDANGKTTVSPQASLTVLTPLTGSFAYSTTSPYNNLINNIDNGTYQVNFAITDQQPFSITLPSGSSPNQYLTVRSPIGQPIKTIWYNTVLNNGTIPDSVWYPVITFGGFNFYTTRNLTSMDTTQKLTMT